MKTYWPNFMSIGCGLFNLLVALWGMHDKRFLLNKREKALIAFLCSLTQVRLIFQSRQTCKMI